MRRSKKRYRRVDQRADPRVGEAAQEPVAVGQNSQHGARSSEAVQQRTKAVEQPHRACADQQDRPGAGADGLREDPGDPTVHRVVVGAGARHGGEREQRALVERTSAQLRAGGQLLRARTVLRVVLAHRNAWFLDKVSRSLQDNDVEVLAQTDNGADAIGYCVAEQPDLVLLEDSLEMVPGEQVVRQIKLYVPHAVIAAQAAESSGVPRLIEAGADAVFTRQVPPLAIIRSLLDLKPV